MLALEKNISGIEYNLGFYNFLIGMYQKNKNISKE